MPPRPRRTARQHAALPRARAPPPRLDRGSLRRASQAFLPLSHLRRLPGDDDRGPWAVGDRAHAPWPPLEEAAYSTRGYAMRPEKGLRVFLAMDKSGYKDRMLASAHDRAGECRESAAKAGLHAEQLAYYAEKAGGEPLADGPGSTSWVGISGCSFRVRVDKFILDASRLDEVARQRRADARALATARALAMRRFELDDVVGRFAAQHADKIASYELKSLWDLGALKDFGAEVTYVDEETSNRKLGYFDVMQDPQCLLPLNPDAGKRTAFDGLSLIYMLATTQGDKTWVVLRLDERLDAELPAIVGKLDDEATVALLGGPIRDLPEWFEREYPAIHSLLRTPPAPGSSSRPASDTVHRRLNFCAPLSRATSPAGARPVPGAAPADRAGGPRRGPCRVPRGRRRGASRRATPRRRPRAASRGLRARARAASGGLRAARRRRLGTGVGSVVRTGKSAHLGARRLTARACGATAGATRAVVCQNSRAVNERENRRKKRI